MTLTNAIGPAGLCVQATLDQNTGSHYVPTRSGHSVWKYASGLWTDLNIHIPNPISVTVDPHNSDTLVVANSGGSVSFSTDAGKTWKKPTFSYSGTQGFSGTKHYTARCTSKILMDTKSIVWMINGNDGVLRWQFDANATNTCFTPDTAGVENFCAMDLAFPKNWGGKAIVTVMDEGALVVNNLDTFDVTPLFMQNWLNNCVTIAPCPNDSDTCIVCGWASCITTNGFKTFTPNKEVKADRNFHLFPTNVAVSDAVQMSCKKAGREKAMDPVYDGLVFQGRLQNLGAVNDRFWQNRTLGARTGSRSVHARQVLSVLSPGWFLDHNGRWRDVEPGELPGCRREKHQGQLFLDAGREAGALRSYSDGKLCSKK